MKVSDTQIEEIRGLFNDDNTQLWARACGNTLLQAIVERDTKLEEVYVLLMEHEVCPYDGPCPNATRCDCKRHVREWLGLATKNE